jgi:hypothetical protein
MVDALGSVGHDAYPTKVLVDTLAHFVIVGGVEPGDVLAFESRPWLSL